MTELIRVRVATRAKNESIRKARGVFEISVREKPEGNAANKRAVELVARELGIAASRIRIVNGHHRPSKLLSLPK